MAGFAVPLAVLLLLTTCFPSASGRATSRQLGYYQPPSSSGSSPSSGSPSTPSYTPPSSGSSPYSPTPSAPSYTPPSSGSSPSPSSTPPSSGSSPSGSSPTPSTPTPLYSTPSSSGSSPSGSSPPYKHHKDKHQSGYSHDHGKSHHHHHHKSHHSVSPSYGSPPSSGSSPIGTPPTPVVQAPPTYTPPASGSSPGLTPPYGSGSPISGSSPTVGPPISSPVVGAPIISPNIGSPISSPIIGSPLSSPMSGSPLTSPTVGSPITSPSGGGSPSYGRSGSCEFWKKHHGQFPSILSGVGTLFKLFGSRAGSVYGPKMTVMEALANPYQDGYSELARQGTASLLNSYTVAGFAYTPLQVRQELNAALDSPDLARQQASKFEQANLSV